MKGLHLKTCPYIAMAILWSASRLLLMQRKLFPHIKILFSIGVDIEITL